MSRSYNVEGCEQGDVEEGLVPAVCMCRTVEEYIHGDGVFTGRVTFAFLLRFRFSSFIYR
jgi:hypothetical protein